MLSKLQLMPLKLKQWPLSTPREQLRMRLRQKLPPSEFKRTFKLPSMSSSRNNKQKREEKQKSRDLLEKRKNKKDLKESRNSMRNKPSKRKNLLRR